jgi:hypothetical protein
MRGVSLSHCPVNAIMFSNLCPGQSQWSCGLRHELSLLTQTLESWVQIPFKGWMSVLCAFILCVGRGLAMGWSPVQGILLTVYRIKTLKKWPKPNKELYNNNNNSNLCPSNFYSFSVYFTLRLPSLTIELPAINTKAAWGLQLHRKPHNIVTGHLTRITDVHSMIGCSSL